MYLGNQPALSYTSFAKQDFTTSATTSYTLDNPVANANELALFINFVRQEPTTAYSASGTSLTLTSATSASDDMYCVFLGKAVQTVNPPNASVGASQIVDSSIALGKLSATGTKDATTFLRGDNTFASAGGNNTPSFGAYMSASQSATNEVFTKITFDTEDWDIGSGFDTSNNRFVVPSGEAGKYVFGAKTGVDGIDDQEAIAIAFYKNGTREDKTYMADFSPYINRLLYAQIIHVFDLAVGDYIEAFASQSSGGTENLDSRYSYFYGYKIIE
jgi:hypothetical protein